MTEVTLRRILTLARNNPDDPCPDQKTGSGKSFKISEEPDGVHAKELLTERGEILSLYVHKLLFLFSCQFAVFFSESSVSFAPTVCYLLKECPQNLVFSKTYRVSRHCGLRMYLAM